MTDQNKDQKPRNQGPTAKTLTEKVRPIQERARQIRVVPDGWDGKAFMDEAWSEDSERDDSRLNDSCE